MKVKTLYICETCGQEYLCEAAAIECEGRVIDLALSPVRPGDVVRVYERYAEPDEDKIVSLAVEGRGASAVNGWIDKYGPKEGWRRFREVAPNWKFHYVVAEVENFHALSDEDSRNIVDLASIMLNGNWLTSVEK